MVHERTEEGRMLCWTRNCMAVAVLESFGTIARTGRTACARMCSASHSLDITVCMCAAHIDGGASSKPHSDDDISHTEPRGDGGNARIEESSIGGDTCGALIEQGSDGGGERSEPGSLDGDTHGGFHRDSSMLPPHYDTRAGPKEGAGGALVVCNDDPDADNKGRDTGFITRGSGVPTGHNGAGSWNQGDGHRGTRFAKDVHSHQETYRASEHDDLEECCGAYQSNTRGPNAPTLCVQARLPPRPCSYRRDAVPVEPYSLRR
mmetsp:Transcript_16408/g.38273  ORF Transcript_16408/g.38273 Transcript_16408/m.38273 type:complete len:262 (+) Transcript_16408:1290-2075(+)